LVISLVIICLPAGIVTLVLNVKLCFCYHCFVPCVPCGFKVAGEKKGQNFCFGAPITAEAAQDPSVASKDEGSMIRRLVAKFSIAATPKPISLLDYKQAYKASSAGMMQILTEPADASDNTPGFMHLVAAYDADVD
jgi:hypothetical protein